MADMRKIKITDIVLRVKINDTIMTRSEISVAISKNTQWRISNHHDDTFIIVRNNVFLSLTKAEVENMFDVISANSYQAGHPSEIKDVLDEHNLQMNVHILPENLRKYYSAHNIV